MMLGCMLQVLRNMTFAVPQESPRRVTSREHPTATTAHAMGQSVGVDTGEQTGLRPVLRVGMPTDVSSFGSRRRGAADGAQLEACCKIWQCMGIPQTRVAREFAGPALKPGSPVLCDCYKGYRRAATRTGAPRPGRGVQYRRTLRPAITGPRTTWC